MPQMQAIVINDGAGTPVAHTFSPVTTDGSKAQWADRSPSVPEGFKILNHEYLPPNGSRTVHQIKMGLSDPTVATIDSVDQVVRYESGSMTLNFHPQSTEQERKNQRTYWGNLLLNANIQTSIDKLEPFW